MTQQQANVTPEASKIIKDLEYLRRTAQRYADKGGIQGSSYTSGGKVYKKDEIPASSFVLRVERYSCLIECVRRHGASFFDMPNRLKLYDDVYQERKRQCSTKEPTRIPSKAHVRSSKRPKA